MPGNKKKKIAEVSADIGYVNEQAVTNGTIENCEIIVNDKQATTISKDYAFDNLCTEFESADKHQHEPGDIYEQNTTKDTYSTTDLDKNINPINLESLRRRLQNGEPASSIYESIKEFIIGNKNNPNNVSYVISYLMREYGKKLYDPNINHSNFSKDPAEFLKTILEVPEDETLDGFVCIEIHEFGMRLLHDCGIPAVVFGGKSNNGEGHATLLYKQEDGKYVHVNYNTTYTINADNIKDAAYTAIRRSAGLECAGYLEFIDDNGSYQEFLLKDESVWGRELDKRDYNNRLIGEQDIANKSGVGGTVNYSNLGSISAEANGTYAYGSDNRPRELKGALAYKKSNNTTFYDHSTSAGLKLEYNGYNKNDKGKTFFETQVVLANTKGENHDNITSKDFRIRGKNLIYDDDYSVQAKYEFDPSVIESQTAHKIVDDVPANSTTIETKKNTGDNEVNEIINDINSQTEIINTSSDKTIDNKTFFIRGVIGKEKNLLDDGGIRLSNTYQGTLTGGFNYADNQKGRISGDARITLENGLKLQNNIGNVSLTNNVSGGLVGDLRLYGGDCVPGIQPGIKLNASSGFSAHTDNVVFGASAKGFAVVSQPCIDYGVNGNIFGSVKPENSDVTIFGAASVGNTKQQLRIGGFDERTEDITIFGATIGAENKKGAVSLSYNKRFDRLNSTRDREVISLNAKINL